MRGGGREEGAVGSSRACRGDEAGAEIVLLEGKMEPWSDPPAQDPQDVLVPAGLSKYVCFKSPHQIKGRIYS